MYDKYSKIWDNISTSSVLYFRAEISRQREPILWVAPENPGKLVSVTVKSDPHKDTVTAPITDIIINGINISHSARLVTVLLARITYLEKELGVTHRHEIEK